MRSNSHRPVLLAALQLGGVREKVAGGARESGPQPVLLVSTEIDNIDKYVGGNTKI